jgi:hypothetical protein
MCGSHRAELTAFVRNLQNLWLRVETHTADVQHMFTRAADAITDGSMLIGQFGTLRNSPDRGLFYEVASWGTRVPKVGAFAQSS